MQGDLIAVPDPLAALGRLAAYWRAKFDIPLAVVVGSNGKTTVKEMTAAILRAHFGDAAVLATAGQPQQRDRPAADAAAPARTASRGRRSSSA